MDSAQHLTGQKSFSCSDFSVRAVVAATSLDTDVAATGRVDLVASGPDDNGAVSLSANGQISAGVGESSLAIRADGIVVDGGNLGNIGIRAGTAPMMQYVGVEGNGGSILLQNGQLPVAPKIEVKADSIILSVGPNKITIGPTGISIEGLQVAVKGEVSAKMTALDVAMEGEISATMKANATATVQAAGQAVLKGAIVMIN
jgi:hypothetical protein